MPNSLYILKWFKDDESDKKVYVNVVYIKSEHIHLAAIIFTDEEYINFTKSRKKTEIIENIIINKYFLLNEDISHFDEVNDFIRKHKLEKKIREYKLKKLLK